jgi:methylmalonyl-CoA/ethylmalonyl-CoA epimerase
MEGAMPNDRPSLNRPTGIGQIAIAVADLDRAVAWYADVLGLALLFRAPPGLAFFDCGGVPLLLSAPEPPGSELRTSVVYYQVEDIHAAHAALRSRGAELVDEPHLIARLPDHDLWMSFCRDSEGNLLGLMSEIRAPAA